MPVFEPEIFFLSNISSLKSFFAGEPRKWQKSNVSCILEIWKEISVKYSISFSSILFDFLGDFSHRVRISPIGVNREALVSQFEVD